MAKVKTNKIKPSANLFKNSHAGRFDYNPLQHKDGRDFDDIDYFELLGRKAIQMDKENPNPNLPTNYGDFDRDVVDVAKQVCKAIDEGKPRTEIQQFLSMCIDIEK